MVRRNERDMLTTLIWDKDFMNDDDRPVVEGAGVCTATTIWDQKDKTIISPSHDIPVIG